MQPHQPNSVIFVTNPGFPAVGANEPQKVKKVMQTTYQYSHLLSRTRGVKDMVEEEREVMMSNHSASVELNLLSLN